MRIFFGAHRTRLAFADDQHGVLLDLTAGWIRSTATLFGVGRLLLNEAAFRWLTFSALP